LDQHTLDNVYVHINAYPGCLRYIYIYELQYLCLLFSIDHPALKMVSQTKTCWKNNKVIVIQPLVCTLFLLEIYYIDALLPLLVNFALECAIRRVPSQSGTKNGIGHISFCLQCGVN